VEVACTNLVFTNDDLLDKVAVSKLDKFRVVEGRCDFSTCDTDI
jgi:hypothetical protein